MQSVPLLLRHSIRSGVNLSRASRPIRTQLPPAGPSPFPAPQDLPRNFSVCLHCQFRSRPALYSPNGSDKGKDEHAALERKDGVDSGVKPEVQAEEQQTRSALESENVQRCVQEQPQQQKQEAYHEQSPDRTAEGHGLPSFKESRRSQWSKQFSTMMDTLQSNIFVAGQRLNEVTGYSSIEALKRDIYSQGMIKHRT